MKTCANCNIDIPEQPRSKKFCSTDCAHDFLNIKKVYGKYDIRPQYPHICRYCCNVYYVKRKKSYYCSGSHRRLARAMRKKIAYRNHPRVIEDANGNLVETHPAKQFVMSDLIGYTPRGDVPPEYPFEPEPEIKHPVKCPVCEKDAPRAVWGAYQEFPWICSRECLDISRAPKVFEALESRAKANGDGPRIDPATGKPLPVTPEDMGIDRWAVLAQVPRSRRRSKEIQMATTITNTEGFTRSVGIIEPSHTPQEPVARDERTEAESIALAIQAAQALIRKASSDNLL